MIPYLRILHKCHWQIPPNKLLQRFHLRENILKCNRTETASRGHTGFCLSCFKEKANIMKDLDQAVAAQAFEDRAKKIEPYINIDNNENE